MPENDAYRLKASDRRRLINKVSDWQSIIPPDGEAYPKLERVTVSRFEGSRTSVEQTVDGAELRAGSPEALVDGWFDQIEEACKYQVMAYVDRGEELETGEKRHYKPSVKVSIVAVRAGREVEEKANPLGRSAGRVIETLAGHAHIEKQTAVSSVLDLNDKRVEEVKAAYQYRQDTMDASTDAILELNLRCAQLEFQNSHQAALLEEKDPGFWSTPAGERMGLALVEGIVPRVPDLLALAVGVGSAVIQGVTSGKPAPADPAAQLESRITMLEASSARQLEILEVLAGKTDPPEHSGGPASASE